MIDLARGRRVLLDLAIVVDDAYMYVVLARAALVGAPQVRHA
jgi:hypothetical protein